MLLLLALFERVNIYLQLDGSSVQYLVEPGPLLHILDLSDKLTLNLHRSRITEASRHLARFRVLLVNELVDGDLR